jgi:hypothetical protein
MKRLDALLLFLLLIASCDQVNAQMVCTPVAPATYCISGLVQTGQNVTVGGAVNFTAYFTSSVAATNITLATVVYDPTGNQVAKGWQTGVTVTPGTMFSAQTIVYQPLPTALTGTYTISLGVYEGSGTQDFWQNSVATLAVTPVLSQPSPPCLPKVQWPLAVTYGTIPTGISTRYDTYAVWVCNTSSGYITWADLFTLTDIAPLALQYMAGSWTTSQAQADCATSCVAPTSSEYAYQQTLIATASPKALVAFNGASLTRSVYTVNAGGSLNPTPLTGVTVAVGAPCDATTRIPTAPSYFSVAGGTNTAGGFIPKNSYTICSVSLPIGAN